MLQIVLKKFSVKPATEKQFTNSFLCPPFPLKKTLWRQKYVHSLEKNFSLQRGIYDFMMTYLQFLLVKNILFLRQGSAQKRE